MAASSSSGGAGSRSAGAGARSAGSSSASGVEEAEVDNRAAGGFFARWGREPTQQDLGEHAGIHL